MAPRPLGFSLGQVAVLHLLGESQDRVLFLPSKNNAGLDPDTIHHLKRSVVGRSLTANADLTTGCASIVARSEGASVSTT